MDAASDQPLVLTTVLPDGLAADAAGYGWAQARRPLLLGAGFAAAAVTLAVTTGHAAWLLLVVLWLALAVAADRMRRQQFGAMLRAGSEMTTEWGPSAVRVIRPISTVTFEYAGMTVVRRTPSLVQLGVPHAGTGRRALLSLPTALAPDEALARITTAVPEQDPFGAASLPRTFRCPEGFPPALPPMSGLRVAVLAVLMAFEVLCLVLLALLGEWVLVLVCAAFVVLALLVVTGPWRAARRCYRPGALVGASLTDGRIVLALPDQRLDVPEARLRRLAPAGPDLVAFTFSAAPGVLLVPRALVTDDDVDRLRALLGKAPLKPSQRVDLHHESVR